MISKRVIAFPGREAIAKGLDDSFYNSYKKAKEIIDEGSEYLKIDLVKACYGSKIIDKKLEMICLLTHCYAIYEVIEDIYGKSSYFAGYSQGEFIACVAAGFFEYPHILKTIKELESILQDEQKNNESMYRIIDFNTENLEKCIIDVDKQQENVCISAFISDTQNIISGKNEYVEKVAALAKENGARWAIDLHSDKAYHCILRNDSYNKAKNYFDEIKTCESNDYVYSCYDGNKSCNAKVITDRLSYQINNPIRWNTIAKNMRDQGITEMIEIGPGCTVSANTRIAENSIKCTWIGNVGDL